VPLGEAHLTFCDDDDDDDDDAGHDVADHDVSGVAAVLILLAAVVVDVDVDVANAQLFGVDVLVDGDGLCYCQTLSWMQPQPCYYYRCITKRGGMQCKRASWCEASHASSRATLAVAAAAAAVAVVVYSPNN